MSDILKRSKSIMEAHINDILDQMEDPAKQSKKILRYLERDLASVKNETASVMAAEKAAERDLTRCRKEIKEMDDYAEKAVMAGNDEDAQSFLSKKVELVNDEAIYAEIYEHAKANAASMREMHNKLVKDINACQMRQRMVAGKVSVAKTKETVNKAGASIDKASSNVGEFSRMEEKATSMLDTAMAREELDAESVDPTANLKAKYSDASTTVSDELAALKARLGK